ncbi:MAG: alpha/beta hydrolase [Hyphomonadaceae bacterium]|nr:alpha/beta hydrolase [Hyphomonadaceae bacterium]
MTGFVETLFATADGPRLEVRDYAPAGAVSGAPVLCLHGLTRNVRDFDELAPRIAGLGRRVIVASQRGRGGSDRDPMPARYNPAIYAGDMLALLDQLSVERAVYVGTSMGGLMTMITAAIAPQRIAAAVLNDIGPEIDPAGLARIQSYVGKTKPVETWADAIASTRILQSVAFPKETSDAFWEAFARRAYREEPDGRVVLDYDPAIAQAFQPAPDAPAADLWPLFEALKPVPVLLVRGGISDLLSAATVEEMRRRKPDLKAVSVPDVGHAPYMTEPAAWAAIEDFLRSL